MQLPGLNLGVTALLIVVCYLMLTVLQMTFVANDPGVGWHLKTGELISQTGIVPRTDPFLFAETPRPWVSDQWLGDLVLYEVYKFGGWPFVYGLCTAVYFGTFFLLIFPAVRRESGSALIAALAVLLGFKLGQVHFIVRPVLLGFPLFAAVYRLLLDARWKLSQGKQPYLNYSMLILLFFLWANTHPSFVLGGLLLGMYMLALSWDRVFYNKYSNLTISPTAVALGFFCVAGFVTVINPYGLDLHRSIVALNNSQYFMRLHVEWQGVDFRKAEGQVFEGVVLLIFTGIALGSLRGKFRPFEVFSLVFFGHMSLMAVRGLPYFGMVCALPLAQGICSLADSRVFKEFTWGKVITDAASAIKERENATQWRPVVWAGVLVPLVSSLLWGAVWPYRGEYGPNDKRYSFKALEMMKSAVMEPTVVINHSNFGGFITWYGAPLLKPIHDDRNTLLGESFYKEMERVLSIGNELRAYALRVNAKFLMINSDSAQAKHLRVTREFPVFFDDEAVAVFDLRGLWR